MNRLDLKMLVHGIGLGLLVLVPIFAVLVATFRPDYFETKAIRDLGFGVLWITGIVLLLLDRLVEFDFGKGIFKGKLTDHSGAASLGEATRDSGGRPEGGAEK